ncbi:ATP-dependent RNA helicase DeaD [Breznakia sp. PF5-3]|uniref:DEAD/DEAH box helicase n=1 Tax=unclassified Breznakia TaxID=2623764 RepID=UPI0024054FE4|nr:MULTISPECIES: DEAD/DEAH box helicase [unclassified Breznakia]MDF9825410.1 ATP-dependent RNA helicase DeaD [Breznakia sp. PM6-1]MDF9836288.1 ATP-dependent RNA helicase DeaD [Breznakia sp. PF5-3]MDF9838712.1 ATP-dependent RNA helicase DeaD [Breznakia sp. PFB2-8]MDF9860743.1 ATP-dependent RNA helicase DeaD [Breznakia sp. PH5-24]
MKNFEDYIKDKEILKAIDKLGYKQPTPVQEEVFPLVLNNKDVIVKSQTGSGKTAAFAIPMLQSLDWNIRSPQILVLTPTRELAIQVKEDMFHIGRYKRYNVQAIFGKMSFEGQAKQLKQRTHVVVGTPGRVLDHIQQGTLNLSAIKYLVIDEADEMFTMGFEDQMRDILSFLNKNRITALLSATLDEKIQKLCKDEMTDPVYVEVESDMKVTDLIRQEYYVVENDKETLLRKIIMKENSDSCIIFCNTQLEVNQVYEHVFKEYKIAKKIHGGMDQKDRIKVIKEFKLGYFRYLIATDVASRGLDIDQVELVVNYDIPFDAQTYVHRIGRTGRIGNTGKAITFVLKEEKRFLDAIQSIVEAPLEKQVIDERKIVEYQEAFDNKIQTRKELKKEKQLVFKDEILKLHINAGKKTKMRAGDIVGAICSIEDIEVSDIGVISIVDVSTFVEILNNKGEKVYQALQTIPIKGRIRKVNKANLSSYEMDYQKQVK